VVVSLYAGGARVRAGALQFDDRAAPRAPIGRWSTVTPSTTTLEPGASSDVHIRIEIPRDAVAGEQLGVVWAETRLTGPTGASVNRVGVRIYLAVADRPPASDLELVSATPLRDASGAPQVEVTVRNTGGREIEPAGDVAPVDHPTTTAPFAPGLALMAGGRGTMRATLATPIATGPTRVDVHVRANGIERDASATMTFPTRPGTRGDPVALDRGARGTSRTGPVAVALVLAALAALGASRARRRSPSAPD